MGAQATCDDMRTGWMHMYPGVQTLNGLVFGVRVVFEGERLDSYSLWLHDARYGTSWDDWSEEKQLAQRNAHDAWLVAMLGPGHRERSPRGSLGGSFLSIMAERSPIRDPVLLQ